MSHFVKLKTKFTKKGYLTKAIENLGFVPEEGGNVRGYQGNQTQADLRFRPTPNSYDIGFQKQGGSYVCIADWFGVRGVQPSKLLQELAQEYAVVAAKDRLAAQGFSLAREERIKGRVHLVLRRAA